MRKAEKGITLVALIITIIVLLILAVVAIGAVKNDGIINYAKNARSAYEAAAERENQELQNYLNYLKPNKPGQGNSENGGEEQQPQEPGEGGEDDGTEVEPPVPQEPTLELVSGSDENNDGKLNYNETWILSLKDAQGNTISGVSYSSNDTSIATVNSNGTITGVSHGTTTITATYTDNGETKNKSYNVNVVENIQQISFWLESSYLSVGDTTRVIVETSPTTNPKGTFEYRSSNNSVATIDNNGNVKGISSGSFGITVYYYPPEGSDGYQIREGGPEYLVDGGIEPEDPFDEL